MNEYQQPLTGNEKRLSGLQRIQQNIFQKSVHRHESNLQNMKPSLDTSAPKVPHAVNVELPSALSALPPVMMIVSSSLSVRL